MLLNITTKKDFKVEVRENKLKDLIETSSLVLNYSDFEKVLT